MLLAVTAHHLHLSVSYSMAKASVHVRASFSQMPIEKTAMTRDDALQRFRHIARERAFGRYVGSDRLIQAGLDALIAGVESPSLAMPAGLLRSEEPEAPALSDQVLEKLGLLFHAPAEPWAAKRAKAHYALSLDDWDESWGASIEQLNKEAVEAAKQFLGKRRTAEARD
ncbi:hypothetical protein ACGFZG_34080 [Streptomyces antibioticus]|uniref:hypothetical protein n=1 Tax=Streptomyces antibioticus TaxID=1890 RepID=UPI003713023D